MFQVWKAAASNQHNVLNIELHTCMVHMVEDFMPVSCTIYMYLSGSHMHV